MKTYTIIGGVNGAGKSSLSGVLKRRLDDLGVIVDVDKLTANLGKGAIEGGKAAVSLIDDCLARGISFAQETTLSGHRTEKTAQAARDRGYSVRLFYVGLATLEESLKRIKNRVERGGHDIPCEDVARRFNERFDALRRVLPYCDSAELYDNDNGFTLVAEYRNGELIALTDKRPAWLIELLG